MWERGYASCEQPGFFGTHVGAVSQRQSLSPQTQHTRHSPAPITLSMMLLAFLWRMRPAHSMAAGQGERRETERAVSTRVVRLRPRGYDAQNALPRTTHRGAGHAPPTSARGHAAQQLRRGDRRGEGADRAGERGECRPHVNSEPHNKLHSPKPSCIRNTMKPHTSRNQSSTPAREGECECGVGRR